eukprot:1186301-Pleurochrysis_carterae.AAC.4
MRLMSSRGCSSHHYYSRIAMQYALNHSNRNIQYTQHSDGSSQMIPFISSCFPDCRGFISSTFLQVKLYTAMPSQVLTVSQFIPLHVFSIAACAKHRRSFSPFKTVTSEHCLLCIKCSRLMYAD